MSYSRLKQNLRATTLFWLAGLVAVALWTVSQTNVGAAQTTDERTATMVRGSAQALQSQPTLAEMEALPPMELLVYDDGSHNTAGTALQSLGQNAPGPGAVSGYDPAEGLAAFARRMAAGPIIPRQPMVSPPFTGPGFPTDYINYSPFQRYTHFGSYFTYPVSTVGKLFILGVGQCSASVVGRNTIVTAAHCVHSGGPGGGFYTGGGGWVFCPSYTSGGCIRGQWGWTFAATTIQWVTSSLSDRDFACIVTNNGSAGQGPVGSTTGWLGYAYNWSTRYAEFAWGYPAQAPFPGNVIITSTSTEWYEQDWGNDGAGNINHRAKYIGSDQTPGSSGGPWWISHRHPNAALDYGDTDGSALTDPPSNGVGNPSGGPYINGLNSHKRCNASGCPAGSVFTQEMGSPQFLWDGTVNFTGPDDYTFIDVLDRCYRNGGS
jgi:V8-like Glu-specific endopeptidase